ncbi:MAG TPA: hypothetical protein VHG93_01990, partial [Longimicrobium sp.]|nr:hypothetical protein [Longimicrobium sp.]
MKRRIAGAPRLYRAALGSLIAWAPAAAQALPGTSGLVTIPTAAVAADGELTVGVNHIAKGYHEYYRDGRFDENAAIAQFVTVGFL